MSARRTVQPVRVERSWLEYPDGIPVESWDRDHYSTLLYAETRAVDHQGKLLEYDPHLRQDGRTYPTRLQNNVVVYGHSDVECLIDAQAAGLIEWDRERGIVTFTEAGWEYVHRLRRIKAGR